MTDEQRQDLLAAIKQERDRLLAMGSTTKHELWDVVEQEHPEVVKAWTSSLARQKGLDYCQDSLVATVAPDELPLMFPEFGEERRTYTVREGRVYRYVPVEQANLSHVDGDLAVSARNRGGEPRAPQPRPAPQPALDGARRPPRHAGRRGAAPDLRQSRRPARPRERGVIGTPDYSRRRTTPGHRAAGDRNDES